MTQVDDQNDHKGTLYLLPNALGAADHSWHSEMLVDAISRCQHFIVESHKMARRLLHALAPDRDLDALEYYHLNKRVTDLEIHEMVQPLLHGSDVGLISDAGLPAIADPGAVVVSLAHRQQIRVCPVPGPSSIFLALMASGLNGQHFEFVGYLPQQAGERKSLLKTLVGKIRQTGLTIIFIETPYRNQALFNHLITVLDPNVRLCLAIDLTLQSEEIATREISQWKYTAVPNLDKRPCVFLIGK